MNRSARHLVLVLAGLGAVLAGCGGSAPASISASTATTLHRDVRQIRVAAAGGDTAAARAAVTTLRTDIARLAARGQLASGDAAVLLVDAGQITARIGAAPPPSTAPATTAPATSQKAAPGQGKGKGKGNGNGHGQGNGGGDGGNGGGD